MKSSALTVDFRYGALDAKVARLSTSIPDLVFKAVAGPTHNEDLKPFKWTSTGVKPVPKFRTIDEFDFEPITFKVCTMIRVILAARFC